MLKVSGLLVWESALTRSGCLLRVYKVFECLKVVWILSRRLLKNALNVNCDGNIDIM